MDFVRLGPAWNSDYQPDKMIEGYSSLIWVERFLDPGSFEMRSTDVERMSTLIPEGTMVSLLDSRETMLVESHEIVRNDVGDDEILVKGRSTDLIFDHRYVEANYQQKRTMRKAYSAMGAALVLMWNAIDNSSGKDVTRGDASPLGDWYQGPEINDFGWTLYDVVPNVSLTESVAVEGDGRKWLLEEGMLGPQLMKILDDYNLGVRTMRPIPSSPAASVISIRTALAERGDIVRTVQSNLQSLRFDVYQGVDRSSSVRFVLPKGHLEDPQYLQSAEKYKSIAEIKSGLSIPDVALSSDEGEYRGLRRRVMDYDAGTPEIPEAPEKPAELPKNATRAQKEARAEAMDKWLANTAKWKNKRDSIIAEFKAESASAARRELRANRRVKIFTGTATQLAPYKYKTHYDLGDQVTLDGDYGYSSKMVVSEFIRTEDRAEGDRGFPGLVAP